MPDDLEEGVVHQVQDIFFASREEIIDTDDLMAIIEKPFAEV